VSNAQCKPEPVTSASVGGTPSQPTADESRRKPDQLGGLRRFALAITVFSILGHLWFGFEQSYAQPLVSVGAAYATQLLLDTLEAWVHHRRPKFLGGFSALVSSLLSAHISGLACAMLLYANDHLWVVCFASAVAIGSKTLFRMPVVNPHGAWPLLLFQLVLFVLLLQAGDATGHWFPIAPQWVPTFRVGMLALALLLMMFTPPGVPSRHYLNPSNFGITVTLLLFPWVGIAAPTPVNMVIECSESTLYGNSGSLGNSEMPSDVRNPGFSGVFGRWSSAWIASEAEFCRPSGVVSIVTDSGYGLMSTFAHSVRRGGG
jgi:hypothetical protein